jgi:hypothetical protein
LGNLIVRVYRQGSSRDYFFTGSGPYTVGGSGCDVVLDTFTGEALQIKISGGQIFIHRLTEKTVSLAQKILPLRNEVAYPTHSTLELEDFHLSLQLEDESQELPPPLLEADHRARQEALTKKIHTHQAELKGLQSELAGKERKLTGVTAHLQDMQKEKHQFQLLIDQLKIEKRGLEGELSRHKETARLEGERLRQVSVEVQDLSHERAGLHQHIQKLQLDLRQSKAAQAVHEQEMHQQQEELAVLGSQIEEARQQLRELEKNATDTGLQVSRDQERLGSVLRQSQSAVEEKQRLNLTILELQGQKEKIQNELEQLDDLKKSKEALVREAQEKIDGFKLHVQLEEANLKNLKHSIACKLDEEVRLKSAQEVLRAEAQKLDNDLARRRGQYAGLEAEHQRSRQELSKLEFAAEDVKKRITHLQEDEQRQQYKLQWLRKETETSEAQLDVETKKARAAFEGHQSRLTGELEALRAKLESMRLEAAGQELKIQNCKVEFDRWQELTSQIKMEKSEVESELSGLRHQRSELEALVLAISNQLDNFQREKVRREHELQDLSFRFQETNSQLRTAEQEAVQEIQTRRREFEQKIIVDRELLLAEVELIKKKAILEVEEEKRRRLEDAHRSKAEIHREADHLLQQAHERLQSASLEAQEREARAHTRFLEAQAFYQQKQTEAETIVNQAQDRVRTQLIEAEAQIQSEFTARRDKMKAFLAKKQDKSLRGLVKLTELQLQKLARQENRSLAKVETLKRRELKKVSELRQVELSRQQELRDRAALEVREERKNLIQQLKKAKDSQEQELAEAKKLAFQNLSQSKQKMLEEAKTEIQRERQHFEHTKEQRLLSATLAVMKLVTKEQDVPEGFQQNLKLALTQALEGKFSVATESGEKILDFNPLKQKSVIPVLQKYALRVGLPVAVGFVLALDLGTLRSSLVSSGLNLLQQKESAAEKFVQQQKVEWKERNTFSPETSLGYKASYVDNVLYTTDFLAVMEQESFQNDWILKLHDFITRELELSEDVAIGYISSEGALMKELSLARSEIHPSFKEQGIKKMQDLEVTHLGWLGQKVSDSSKLDRIVAFRKKFYENYYLEQFKANRSMAGQPEATTPSINQLLAPAVK